MSINAHEYFCLRLTLAQQGIQVRSISGEPQRFIKLSKYILCALGLVIVYFTQLI